MKFRKIPVVIEAEQFHAYSSKPMSSEFHQSLCSKGHDGIMGNIHIDTLEGFMEIMDNDWIIKGVKGEFYPCKPDIFEATYEKYDG